MSIVVKAIGHRLVIKPLTVEENDPMLRKAQEMGLTLLHRDERLHQISVDRGTIVEIGPNAWKAFDDGHPWAKVGDLIGYTKNAGKWITVNENEHYLVINDEDVVTVLEEKNDD